jgi:hypothetical protein
MGNAYRRLLEGLAKPGLHVDQPSLSGLLQHDQCGADPRYCDGDQPIPGIGIGGYPFCGLGRQEVTHDRQQRGHQSQGQRGKGPRHPDCRNDQKHVQGRHVEAEGSIRVDDQ